MRHLFDTAIHQVHLLKLVTTLTSLNYPYFLIINNQFICNNIGNKSTHLFCLDN